MNSHLEDLLRRRAGAALCWLGNLSWVIAGGGRVVAFDLAMDDEGRLEPSPVSASELAPVLEYLFITHEHGDHFCRETAEILLRESQCRFVLPASCLAKAKRIGIPDNRVVVARPRQPFELDGIHVEPTHAFHGHHHGTIYTGVNLDDCGYLLTLAGLRFLQPGDTLLTQDLMMLSGIDALFVSPTEHNMHITPAARWIHQLRPRYVFPQHFGTYMQTETNAFWTRGYPDELREALDDQMRERYHKLTQGQVFAVSPRDGGV